MKQHQHEVMERPITLRLPSALRERVEAEAARDRRPLASLIRNVVEDWVERRQAAEWRT
jgi:predicted DNA-binding protein